MKYVLIVLMVVLMSSAVLAQPPHSCGAIVSLSVIYDKVDANGYAPRFKEGSQAQFDCIAARDPNFATHREPSAWQALNYWYGLFSQELGFSLGLLPAPTS